jgi:hypothetical protein
MNPFPEVTAEPAKPLAVVHLTWTGQPEPAPRWPRTTLREGWQDWIVRSLMGRFRRVVLPLWPRRFDSKSVPVATAFGHQ